MKKLAPILFLLIFPALFAESVASANTPAVLFINPKFLIFFSLVYGVPALLIRDLWVSRRISAKGVIILGAVYAAFNEGLIAATWLKPNPLNFSNTEAVRVSGVNWHLVVNLIVFHTLFSIIIPIVLSLMLFQQSKGQKLLGSSSTWALLAVTTLIGLANVRHDNLAHAKLALVVIMLAAIALALLMGENPSKTQAINIKNPLLVGLIFGMAFFISFFALAKSAPIVSMIFSIGLLVVVLTFVAKYLDAPNLLSRQTTLLIIGTLIPSATISLTRIGEGQPIVVIATFILLALLLKSQKPQKIA